MVSRSRFRRRKKLKLKVFIVVGLALLLLIYLLCNANAAISSAVESGIKQNFVKAVGMAAEEVLQNVSYSDLVQVRRTNAETQTETHKFGVDSSCGETRFQYGNNKKIYGKQETDYTLSQNCNIEAVNCFCCKSNCFAEQNHFNALSNNLNCCAERLYLGLGERVKYNAAAHFAELIREDKSHCVKNSENTGLQIVSEGAELAKPQNNKPHFMQKTTQNSDKSVKRANIGIGSNNSMQNFVMVADVCARNDMQNSAYYMCNVVQNSLLGFVRSAAKFDKTVVRNYELNSDNNSATLSEVNGINGSGAIEVSDIYVDCAALSLLGYRIARLSEKLYGELSSGGAEFYSGALTGIPSLAFSWGKLKVGLPDNCIVNCGFSNEFDSLGINRSVHTIYFEIGCKVVVSGIFSAKIITESFRMPVAWCIVEGEVPDVILRY